MEDPAQTTTEIPFFKPSYVLIAIDTHSSMFRNEGSPSCFKNCIQVLYRLSEELLLKSDKGGWSPFSVTLCERDDKASFVDFKSNMIQTLKLLEEKSTLTEQQLKEKYMRNYDVDLAAFLQFCNKKFKDITNYYKRTVIFITNNPDPNNGDPNKKFTALNEAKSFHENEIVFQLVVPDEEFDFNLFYSEFFSLFSYPCIEIICKDEEGLYAKLSDSICLRYSNRRMTFYPSVNDTSKYLKVYMKSFMNHKRLLNNSYVASDGTEVKKLYLRANDEKKNKEVYHLKDRVNNKIIPGVTFDLDEKTEILSKLNEFPTGFTLLFISDRLTKLGEAIGEPMILEVDPTEELLYFNDIWQYCVNEEKVLVCASKLRKGARPRAVELIPQYYESKSFLIQQIPYADEIFFPMAEISEPSTYTDEEINVTTELVERLKVSFSSQLFVNEEYSNKENYVRAKLLEEPRKESSSRLVLSPEDIDQKLGEVIGEYLHCFPPPQGVKRKTTKK